MIPTELKSRAIRFFERYGEEVEQIAELLEIKLKQLALAYTINNKLPKEAITIKTRVKKLSSFLKKLEDQGWPDFYYPTEVAKDLIGARVVCWFVDDCYGFLDFLKQSNHLKVQEEDLRPIKDYIKNPKPAGYRALHVFADITYDSVQKKDESVAVIPNAILCEVQVRTKLQDAWGDITHEFFYNAKNIGVFHEDDERLLSSLADNLAVQDKTLLRFRNAYQKLIDKKMVEGNREGFSENT
ncbi:MAG: GTP pyrophosphokinase [Candidatus Scalindua sp.]